MSAAPANIDRQATSTGNIWATGATNATSIMIACYTSRLEISAGRQILTFTYAFKIKYLRIFHLSIMIYTMLNEYNERTNYMAYGSSLLNQYSSKDMDDVFPVYQPYPKSLLFY
jgi:hypothetical protein